MTVALVLAMLLQDVPKIPTATGKKVALNMTVATFVVWFVLTPEGTIARYLFGIDYPPKDLRLALVEAGEGRLGGPTDHLLLYCYRYDPAVGRYTAATMNLLRAGGVATLAALFGFIFIMLRRERRARRETSAPEARPATSRTA